MFCFWYQNSLKKFWNIISSDFPERYFDIFGTPYFHSKIERSNSPEKWLVYYENTQRYDWCRDRIDFTFAAILIDPFWRYLWPGKIQIPVKITHQICRSRLVLKIFWVDWIEGLKSEKKGVKMIDEITGMEMVFGFSITCRSKGYSQSLVHSICESRKTIRVYSVTQNRLNTYKMMESMISENKPALKFVQTRPGLQWLLIL